ncbi:MAG: DUF58 domain-containing protein, partial [Acidobacteriota bacterium]|nr:DUF58 domain-containing protein [Acidobacteriota bacterium]
MAPRHEVSATTTQRWTRSPALAAGAAGALVLASIGLLAGRVDVALLSLPLVAAIALSWDRLPAGHEQATLSIALIDGGDSEVAYRLGVQPPLQAEAIVLRYSVLGGQGREFAVSASGAGELGGSVPLLHSGPQELVRLDYRFLAGDASAASVPEEPLIGEYVVAPGQTAIHALPLPRRLQGMTGPHDSARAGDGGEFRDIHPFTPGDRLRRIDWKATARRGQSAGDLYVRRTNALADATVLIVMDSRDDVGEQVAEWSRNLATHKG